jgi:hypothetical protein
LVKFYEMKVCMILYQSVVTFYFFIIDKLHSSGDILINNHQKENNRSQNIFQLNNTPSSSTIVTTSIATKSYSVQTSYEKNPEPPIGSILSSNSLKFFPSMFSIISIVYTFV